MRDPGRGVSRRGVIGTVLLLLLVALFIRLGFWQLDRREQRRALNARIADRERGDVITDAAELTDTARTLYRRVSLRGHYDVERSIILPGRSYEGVAGVHLLTPLVLDRDRAVLVNRGWVPAADGATIEPDSFPATEDAARGLILPFPRPADSRGGRAPAAAPAGFRRVWYAVDPAALRAQFPYRLLPVTVQLLPAARQAGYPKRLGAPPLDEGPHLSYAIQWFSFAVIAVVGWFALLRGARRDRAASAQDQ